MYCGEIKWIMHLSSSYFTKFNKLYQNCKSVLPIHHGSIWSKKNSKVTKVYKCNITKDYFWEIASLTPLVVYCNTLAFTL